MVNDGPPSAKLCAS